MTRWLVPAERDPMHEAQRLALTDLCRYARSRSCLPDPPPPEPERDTVVF